MEDDRSSNGYTSPSSARFCDITKTPLERGEYICFVRNGKYWHFDIDEKLTREVEKRAKQTSVEDISICCIRADEETLTRAVSDGVLHFNATTLQEVITRISRQIEKRALSLISLANKSGVLVSGADKVSTAIRSGAAKLLIQAGDGSPAEVDKIGKMAMNRAVTVVRLADKKKLGEALGKQQIVHIALYNCGFIDEIQSEIRRLSGFYKENTI